MARPSIRNSPHLVQAPATTTTANLATTKDLDPSSLPDEEVDSSFLPFSLSLSFNPPHTKPIPTATARATVRAQKEQKSTDKQTNRQAMPSTPATTAAPAAAAPTPPTASSSTSSAPTGGRGGGGGAGRYRGGSSRGSGSGGGGSYGKLTESVRSLSVFDVGVGLERRELYGCGLIFVVAARRFACLLACLLACQRSESAATVAFQSDSGGGSHFPFVVAFFFPVAPTFSRIVVARTPTLTSNASLSHLHSLVLSNMCLKHNFIASGGVSVAQTR